MAYNNASSLSSGCTMFPPTFIPQLAYSSVPSLKGWWIENNGSPSSPVPAGQLICVAENPLVYNEAQSSNNFLIPDLTNPVELSLMCLK